MSSEKYASSVEWQNLLQHIENYDTEFSSMMIISEINAQNDRLDVYEVVTAVV